MAAAICNCHFGESKYCFVQQACFICEFFSLFVSKWWHCVESGLSFLLCCNV